MHYLYFKIRVGMFFQILSADFPQPFTNLPILERYKGRGDKFKIRGRIHSDVIHDFYTPLAV
jgi:hypothetical protein